MDNEALTPVPMVQDRAFTGYQVSATSTEKVANKDAALALAAALDGDVHLGPSWGDKGEYEVTQNLSKKFSDLTGAYRYAISLALDDVNIYSNYSYGEDF